MDLTNSTLVMDTAAATQTNQALAAKYNDELANFDQQAARYQADCEVADARGADIPPPPVVPVRQVMAYDAGIKGYVSRLLPPERTAPVYVRPKPLGGRAIAATNAPPSQLDRIEDLLKRIAKVFAA